MFYVAMVHLSPGYMDAAFLQEEAFVASAVAGTAETPERYFSVIFVFHCLLVIINQESNLLFLYSVYLSCR